MVSPILGSNHVTSEPEADVKTFQPHLLQFSWITQWLIRPFKTCKYAQAHTYIIYWTSLSSQLGNWTLSKYLPASRPELSSVTPLFPYFTSMNGNQCLWIYFACFDKSMGAPDDGRQRDTGIHCWLHGNDLLRKLAGKLHCIDLFWEARLWDIRDSLREQGRTDRKLMESWNDRQTWRKTDRQTDKQTYR